jgi:uncharacterized membrane-anchored protein YjiN (DUF445 family)
LNDSKSLAARESFILSHKGNFTLALSALVYVISWLLLYYTAWTRFAGILVSMAEAALIGGLCDYIALKMIFEQKWYFPNSGVLPRNRVKLIQGIATTIENEWLTPQMIGRKLGELDFVGRLGAYVSEVKLDEVIGVEGIDRLLNRAIAYLESPEESDQLDAILRKALPRTFARIYAVMNRFGAQSLNARIAANLRKRLPELRNDPELLKTIESAIHDLGDQLRDPDSYAHRVACSMIDRLVGRAVEASRGQIAQMVRENLARLSDEQIRVQIESKTRTHLDWIRVNGGVFGAVLGLLFALSRMIAPAATAIVTHL